MEEKYFDKSYSTRGIRNNNPFNIKRSSNPWLGKIPFKDSTDKVFEQFDTMEHGIRAGVKLLINYIRKNNPVYGRCNTIKTIINRFAPKSDNPVLYSDKVSGNPYIAFLEAYVGIGRDRVIKYPSPQFFKLCRGIMVFESHYHVHPDYISLIIQQFKLY